MMITKLSPFFAQIFNYLIQSNPIPPHFIGKTLFIYIDPLYINLKVNPQGQLIGCESTPHPDLKICSTQSFSDLIRHAQKQTQPKHYFLEQLNMTGNIGLAKFLSEAIEKNTLSLETLCHCVLGDHLGSWFYTIIQSLVHQGKLSFKELQELMVQHLLYTNPTLVSKPMLAHLKSSIQQENQRLDLLERQLSQGNPL